ncbi:MAG TPA: serine hydrolase domain-containing protein [Actinomycetes bacterium]|nr:serine hydrolase domain-containing protein [Actinomycetes bacterium]
MSDPEEAVDRIAAATGFSGVVRVDGGGVRFARAYGLAHRGHRVANTLDTQFPIASGSKGLTALTVVSLIEEGRLRPATTARSLLGDDLPMIDERVTVEQLLAHRSGIGDYLDEEAVGAVTDYVLPVPVHELATTEQFLRVLDGHPAKFAPGERFSYCNGGYVVLALLAERAAGTPFHELVRRRVCDPAGMRDTEFLRSDELPGRARLPGGRRAADQRPAPPGPGQRGRRRLLHRRRRPRPVGGLVRRADRVAELGRAHGQPPQRGAVGVQALRPRLLAPPVARGRDAGGIRRRRVLLERPRPGRAPDLHGAVQHHRRRLAGRAAPGGARQPRLTTWRLST